MGRLILVLLFVPSLALATPWRDSNDNRATAESNSGSESSSSSESTATAGGGSARVTSNVGGGQGGTGGSSTATTGDSSATGGAATVGNVSGGKVGNVKGGDSQGGAGGKGGNSTSSGGNVTISNEEEYIAPAAPLYVGKCQTGLSGSADSGGFSITNTSLYCDLIDQAMMNWDNYQREIKRCKPICVGVCTKVEASVELQYNDCEGGSKAAHYLALYHEFNDKASELVIKTEPVGFINRIASQLALPIGLVGLLILL